MIANPADLMALYSRESLETLKTKIDLVDLVQSHVELKRAGSAYKGLCPFHDEKSPSFIIQRGDSHYHCFGCQAHGDAIAFLMNHLRMSFSDAVVHLAERFDVPLIKNEGEDKAADFLRKEARKALAEAATFFHFYLLHTAEGHVVLEYLYGRGLDLEFIKAFQVGLAPLGSLLTKVLKEKGYKENSLEAAGLFAKGHDFFQDRITFPIRDAVGHVIGFSARKYKEETFGGKYVNSSETLFFKKSHILFGLSYSRARIAKERKALIVEGQIDALRLIQEGFDFTVASQGTAFTEHQGEMLHKLGVKKVLLAFDSDKAGQEASIKVGDMFIRLGVEVAIVQMP
ncbi:MAG: DNA primase, partial [Chlamydiota bacterium]